MSFDSVESFDPRQYLRVINKRKALLIFPFVGVVFSVLLGSFFIDPIYQSSTTILLAEPQLLSQRLEKMSSQADSRERIDNLRREITSRDNLVRLVKTLQWDADPSLRARAGREREKYPELTVDEIVERWLIGSLRKRIRVAGQGSDILTIVVEDKDPKTALLLAKTLGQVFIDETLRRELSGVRGALDFSNEQLAIYQQQMEDSEEKLRRFRERMVWQSLNRDVEDSDKLDRISSLTTSAETDLRQAEQSVTSLTIRLQNLDAEGPVPISDPRVVEAVQEYHKQGAHLADQLIKYTWRDARIISLSEAINSQRERIRAAVGEICNQTTSSNNPVYCQMLQDLELAKADVVFYRNKWRALRDHVDSYERSLVRGPQDEMTLERLQEEVESNRKLYQMFLDQSQGQQIQEAAHRTAAEGRFRIMEPAMLPLSPVKPDRVRLAVMGCVLGMMLGLALVFLVEYLDHSLSSVEEVERFFGLPVLGTIPRMDLGVKRGRKMRLAMIVVIGLLMALLMALFVKQRLLGA